MNGRRALAPALLTLTLLLSSTAALAQLPQTRITSLFPPGAQRGSTAEVVVGGGTDLDEVDQLVFSHPGITASQKRDAAGNPVANTFAVTVAGDVPGGLYDARVRGLFGVSNPRLFRIDSLPEAAEVEPNNTAAQATPVTLESIVNARSNGAADVDFYRLPMKAGQTIAIHSEAARLDSPMQPLLQLFSSAGRRLLESRRVFSQEASFVWTATADEELLLRVQDAVYGGGDQFVYRLSVSSRPLVDWVEPAFIAATGPAEVTVFGRHLPGGEATEIKLAGQPIFKLKSTIDPSAGRSPVGAGAAAAATDSFWWNGLDGSLVRIGRSELPAASEISANPEQPTTLPAEISGAFAERSDEDIYRFDAKKGESWVIEVSAGRLGSIADPLLMVEKINTAADGAVTYARVATEDDDKQNPGGADLPTLSDDPSFRLDVPDDGSYRVRLRDRYSDARGDARLQYRLSIRKPKADFSLVVFDAFPSADGKAPATSGAVSLRRGGSYELTVYAWRFDGHNEPIDITAAGLPAGITSRPTVIGAGQNSTRLVLTATPDAAEQLVPITIEGRSGAADAQLVRAAQTATLVHDALNGLPRTARLSETLVAGVMKDDQPFSILVDLAAADYSQDQQLLVPVKLIKRNGFDGKVDLTFYNVPPETDAPAFAIEPGKDSAVARIFFKEKAPVLQTTLLLHGTSTVPWRRNPWLAERAKAKAAEAEAAVAALQTKVTTGEAALKDQQAKVTALTADVKKLGEELAAYTVQQQKLKEDFTKAVADQAAALDAVSKAQAQAAAVKTSATAPPEELKAALTALRESANALEAAATRVEQFTTAAAEVAKAANSVKEMEATKIKEKTAAEEMVKVKMKDVEAAQAMLTAAMKEVETAQTAKKAADEAVKKAEDATKPNNVNVRAVADPIVVRIHAAPAKLAAAVPDNGAVRKGASIAVKVTATRKADYKGPYSLNLVLPPGITALKADTVQIPAEQTEATLTITAAADAAPADIANAVIRATADLNGRTAATDVPVTLKVVE
ncbi:MAG: hypothetical protein ACKO2P_01290 [Planctomycetota bacterium]